jgi:hypothetical protein
MIRNVRSRCGRRYLIDADGRLNDFGIQKLVGLVNALQRAVDAMEDRHQTAGEGPLRLAP